MPSLSRNQSLFAVVAAALTVAFFVLLYRLLRQDRPGDIVWLAGAYGGCLFLAGLAFGATDSVARSRSDLGFGYHAITFVVVAVIGLAAAVLHGQPLWPQLAGLAGWAVGLLVHYRFSRRTLKGMPSDEAFP